ncbi:SoxR reducing system RseC family protein [bacterium]|nr:SoxR reducing system RseC family protein [bacterium]
MKERATVNKVEGKYLSVAIAMHDGCASCINNSCKNGRSDLRAYNRDGLEIAEGDQVEIEIAGTEQARGALWVLGLPVVALFAGYGLGRVLFPASGEGPAVAAAGGLFALALAVGLLVQKGRRNDSLPIVTKKFSD